jgi:hypothetical protein
MFFVMQIVQSERVIAEPCFQDGSSVSKWQIVPIIDLRGGADKSLTLPTSRRRRTELIVSLERGVCSCVELQVFSCYRG